MEKSAQLQRKHLNDDVQIISVSNEEVDVIEKFLTLERTPLLTDDTESPTKTYAEAYKDFTVATDSSGKTWDRYMNGTGQSGFPHCVLIGPTGVIEWMGHTAELEEPLQAVVDGTWDRDLERERVIERQSSEAAYRELSKLAKTEKWDAAIDLAKRQMDSAEAEKVKEQWVRVYYDLRLTAGKVDEELLTYYRNRIDQSKDAPIDLAILASSLWSSSKRSGADVSVLANELANALSKVADKPEASDAKTFVFRMLAGMHFIQGKYRQAIPFQEKAIEFSSDGQRKSSVEFLNMLKAKVEDSTPTQSKSQTQKFSHEEVWSAIRKYVNAKGLSVGEFKYRFPEYGRVIDGLSADQKLSVGGFPIAYPSKQTWDARRDVRDAVISALKTAGVL